MNLALDIGGFPTFLSSSAILLTNSDCFSFDSIEYPIVCHLRCGHRSQSFFVILLKGCLFATIVPRLPTHYQLLQTLEWTSIPYKSMLQELFSCRPPIWIFHKTGRNEILEISTISAPLKSGSRSFGYQEKDFHWMSACVRWFTIDHFHSCYSQGPYICLEVISSLLYHLWCHPEWSSNKSVSLRFDVGQLRSHSEVCQFDFTGLC